MTPSIKFPRKDPNNFFQTMRSRVNHYFTENHISKTGNTQMYIKTAAMLSMFLVPYILMLSQVLPTWGAIIWYALMGIGVTGIGLSVMHDANHGSYSRFPWVNRLLSYSMELIGGSSFTWNLQHNVLHHSYTNIYELDEDIEDKPFLRLSPHGKIKKYHRFQHYYALFLYSLSTISWLLVKDFKKLGVYAQKGLTQKSGARLGRETAKMIASKLLYVFYIIALPILVGVNGWAVLLGFVLMHLISGLIITVIFQLAHVVEGPKHYIPETSGTMENTWAIHQLNSTANFAPRNRFITWFVGGLNFQIEHHLFPNICHIHYKKISEIVRTTALEFGLPYHQYPKFREAFASHLRVLRALGNGEMAV